MELWGDPRTGEIALRREGESSVVIVQGKVVDHIDGGHLSELASYRRASAAWFPVRLRYGLTLAAARTALSAGERVSRPSLMTPPQPSWHLSTYTRVWDFDTDIDLLRRSVSLQLPSHIAVRVAGLRLADLAQVRTRGPGPRDTGLSAMITYSSAPTRLGTDDHELILNAAASSTEMGDTNAMLFKRTKNALFSRAYAARLVNDHQAIIQYRQTYIALTATWAPTRSAWRALLLQLGL
ncbi:MAG TPA: hypothetical protein VGH92_07740 [Gaiellaceae bacterium]